MLRTKTALGRLKMIVRMTRVAPPTHTKTRNVCQVQLQFRTFSLNLSRRSILRFGPFGHVSGVVLRDLQSLNQTGMSTCPLGSTSGMETVYEESPVPALGQDFWRKKPTAYRKGVPRP